MTKSGFSGLTSLSELQSLDTEPPIGYFHILSTPANHLLPLVLLITKMSKTILPVLMEKAMATHSSILAWRIPWMGEPGRLQTMGLQESDTT